MANTFISRDEFFNITGMPETRLFVTKKQPDKMAAAHRFAAIDKYLEGWFNELNSAECNTETMPYDLINKYEKACRLILEIRQFEKNLIES